MSRRRPPPSRGRAPLLDSWPLDQPTPAPVPDPEPAPVSEAETRRPPASPSRAEDAHYCRHCGQAGPGKDPPAGWHRLLRRNTEPREHWRAYQTIGLFCSVGCLIAEATAWQARGETTG